MAEKEEKRPIDEKRFAIFSKETIRAIADSVGIGEISDQAAALLGEDVSYRLREATQNSIQYMKHSKRKKLTTDDIHKALKRSDVQPLYGHRPVDTEHVSVYHSSKDGQIMFLDDGEVNLVDIALDSTAPNNPGMVSIKAHWLAVEGVSKSTQTSGSGKPPEKKLSAEIQTYFDRVTNAVLDSDNEVMKVALTDIRTNPQILPLLPYLVNFIANGVKTVSYDLSQLTRILHTLRALLNNRTLYMETQPYLAVLVQSLMECLLEPLTVSISPRYDHWLLRDYAARLLAQLLHSWSSPINHLMHNTVKNLKEILYDSNKPYYSHYGAIMAILMLGQKTIQEVLIPHLPVYVPHLTNVIEDTSTQKTSIKSDAHRVYSVVLQSVEFVLKCQIKEFQKEITKDKEISQSASADNKVNSIEEVISDKGLPNLQGATVSQFYSDMYNYFGDSLTLPCLTETIDFKKYVFKPSKKDELISLADPEAAKTGEELLDEFMEQVRVQEEIRKAQLERDKLEKIRIARERREQEERNKMLREKEEKRRQERKRAELERELVLKRKEEEERLRMLKEHEKISQKEENSSHSEDDVTVPDYGLDDPSYARDSPSQSDHSPVPGIKLKITRGPNKNLHVKTVETMSPPQRGSPNPKHAMSPLYKHSPKSSSPLYKHSPKSHKAELSPHYKNSPKHSHSSKSKDSKDSKHSKKKRQAAKSRVYDEFDFDSDPEEFKPLPFKKANYYSSEGESSDGAGNRKPLTLKIKMKESRDISPE